MTQITLTPQQSGGVLAARDWYSEKSKPVFYLGGCAGTGKTTILPYIIDALGLKVHEVAFAAPTGKAAIVMLRALRKIYGNDTFGCVTSTIHGLMYIPVDQELAAQEEELNQLEQALLNFTEGSDEWKRTKAEFDSADKRYLHAIQNLPLRFQLQDALARPDIETRDRLARRNGGRSHFSKKQRELMNNIKLVVVDEASMVGSQLAADLKTFGVPIIAIGDPMQLPPVRDTAGFTSGKPDFFLTEIHRQALDNPIIQLSQALRRERPLRIGDYGNGVRVIRKRDDDITYDMDKKLPVIVGANKTIYMITNKRRKIWCKKNGLDYRLLPHPGEPLLILQNSRRTGLVNGSHVEVVENREDYEEGQTTFDMTIKGPELSRSSVTMPFIQGHFENCWAEVSPRESAFTAPTRNVRDARKTSLEAQYGWAMTAHKSQGSQWEEIVVHDESHWVARDNPYRWLYTAITRAEKRLTVIVK